MDAWTPGCCECPPAAGISESLGSRTVTRLQRHLAFKLDDVRKHDLIAGQPVSTRALIRSNAGTTRTSSPSRTAAPPPSTVPYHPPRLRLKFSPLDGANGAGLCEGCNKFGCADVYGDSRLSCNAKVPVTRYWHDPMTERLAALARMCGLRVKVEPPPANPYTNRRVDLTVRGLLANGGVLY